jgi:hypothetical protein
MLNTPISKMNPLQLRPAYQSPFSGSTTFMDSFTALEGISVRVILNDKMALLGAAVWASNRSSPV